MLAHHVVLRGGGGALRRRAHTVLVVLDHEDLRQAPQLRHIRRLPHLTLVARAVAEHRHADVHLALGLLLVAVVQVVQVLLRKRQTRSHGSLRAHDTRTAEEVLLRLVHVHRTTLAVSRARLVTQKLVDHRLHARLVGAAAEELHTVATVTGDPVVVGLDHLVNTDGAGFLESECIVEWVTSPSYRWRNPRIFLITYRGSLSISILRSITMFLAMRSASSSVTSVVVGRGSHSTP